MAWLQQPRRTLVRDHMKRPYADRLLHHRFVQEPAAGSPAAGTAESSPTSPSEAVLRSASHLPWHLIPGFEPGETDLSEYTRRLEFLAGIWPSEHLCQLAPRAALQCKGSAFQKVVRISPEKLKVNDISGVKLLVSTLGGVWGKTTLEDKYEKFERAIYGISQRADESNESYMARHEVVFEDMLSQGATLSDVRAYILLRNSALNAEDKKRVVIEAKGHLKYESVTAAIRILGAKFFLEVQGTQKSHRNKTYDVNYVQDGVDDEIMYSDESSNMIFAADASDVPDSIVEQFLAEGDEDALVVQQFEDALIDTMQNDTEMNAFMGTYVEARRKLLEKSKSRGFWPIRSKGAGKKGKSKDFSFRSRKPLAMRIAESNCRHCGQRGHWRAECPRRQQGAPASIPPKVQPTNMMVSASGVSDDEADVFVVESYEHVPSMTDVSEAQKKDVQQSKLMTMSYEELGALVIRFGDAKLGQTYMTVVKEDPKYCQWFIRKYASSSKEEHREFLYFLDLWVERQELELGHQTQAPHPKAKAKSVAKAKAGLGNGSPSTIIDLEEDDELWDQIAATESAIENQNALRLDQIEGSLAQMMSQLQLLTQALQIPK
eukprot:s5018_g3.t1